MDKCIESAMELSCRLTEKQVPALVLCICCFAFPVGWPAKSNRRDPEGSGGKNYTLQNGTFFPSMQFKILFTVFCLGRFPTPHGGSYGKPHRTAEKVSTMRLNNRS
jgi:hypothetical protein